MKTQLKFEDLEHNGLSCDLVIDLEGIYSEDSYTGYDYFGFLKEFNFKEVTGFVIDRVRIYYYDDYDRLTHSEDCRDFSVVFKEFGITESKIMNELAYRNQ